MHIVNLHFMPILQFYGALLLDHSMLLEHRRVNIIW
jgi:hypothetical protein